MITVQKDVYSPFDRFLAAELIRAFDKAKPNDARLRGAVDTLRGWNGQMDKDSAAAMLTVLVYPELRRAVAERAAPGKSGEYNVEIAHAVVEDLLRTKPKDWFADWDTVLLKALRGALDQGEKLQGSNVKGWRYGKFNEVSIDNPVAGKLPLIGRYFDIGPVWMSGSPTTPKQTTRRVGPSMRFVGDTSNWDESLNNITAGESGHLLSGHYKDQWDIYYYANSIRMQYARISAKSTLAVNPGR
jgi:penicillin amidase